MYTDSLQGIDILNQNEPACIDWPLCKVPIIHGGNGDPSLWTHRGSPGLGQIDCSGGTTNEGHITFTAHPSSFQTTEKLSNLYGTCPTHVKSNLDTEFSRLTAGA
jgi:hypothetical protein